MPDTKAEKLCLLVSILQETAVVTWLTVERLVADFPGWLMYVEHLHDGGRNTFASYAFQVMPPKTSDVVEAAEREAMLSVFAPYAALLDNRLSVEERLERIARLTGDQQNAFWRVARNNVDPDIQAAAEELLDKKQERKTLLRASDAPPNAPEELLRAANASPIDKENLLLPSEAGEEPSPQSANFWLRFWKRHQD
jgi:hypothetical protein